MRYVEKNNDCQYGKITSKIKKEIYEIYNGLCSYCDSSADSWNIDHFYPQKNDFPELTFKRNAIENLHLSCYRCNIMKKDKSPKKLLSPNYYYSKDTNSWNLTLRDKISEEFGYLLFFCVSKDKKQGVNRAAEIIKMFNLNDAEKGKPYRTSLLMTRLSIYIIANRNIENIISTLELINKHKRCSSKQCKSGEILRKMLYINLLQFEMMIQESSPFYNMVLDNFGEMIADIYEIIKTGKVLKNL